MSPPGKVYIYNNVRRELSLLFVLVLIGVHNLTPIASFTGIETRMVYAVIMVKDDMHLPTNPLAK